MASWDNNLGMWKASTGGYYNSKADAVAAEGSGAAPPDASSVDLTDFQNSQGKAQTTVQAPDDPNNTPNPNNPGGMSNNDLWNSVDYNAASSRAVANTNAGTGNGLGTAGGALPNIAPRSTGILGGEDFSDSHGRQYQVAAQSPEDYAAQTARMGTVKSDGMVAGTQNLTLTPPGAAGAAGVTGAPQSPATAAAAEQTQRAGNAYDAEVDKTTARDDDAWAKAWSAIDSLQPTDTSLSDEARGYQKEGLQQQRMLLERMLGFDPNQYATQFGDQALARTVAAGRSAGGGYAGQQQGMLAAMDQAPSLYAEGARQASQLETQRLSGAETAAKSFGDLGTLTRGQDAQQAQFESSLGLSIANSVGDLTKGQVQLDQQQTQAFAQIWTDFAKLQSVYAGMDETEQLHYLDQQFQDKQLGQQWKEFKDTLAAQGDIKPKDIIAGFFQLGGGAISALGTMGAASAKSGS